MSRRRPLQRPAPGANVTLFRGALEAALFMRLLQTDFDRVATTSNLAGWAEAKQAGAAGAAARVGVFQTWAVSMGLDVGGRGGPVDKVVGPKTEAAMVLGRHLGFNIAPDQRANLKLVHEALRSDPQLLRQALALAGKPPAEARAALRTILEAAATTNPALKAAVDGLIPPAGGPEAGTTRQPPEVYARARTETTARLAAAERELAAAPTDPAKVKAHVEALRGRLGVEAAIHKDKPAGVPVMTEEQLRALARKVTEAEARARAAGVDVGPARGAAPDARAAARVAALDSVKVENSAGHPVSLKDVMNASVTGRYASDAASSGYKAQVEAALKGDPAALLAVARRLYDPAAMKDKNIVPGHATDARAALQIRGMLARDESVPAEVRAAAARDVALTLSRGVRAGAGDAGVVIPANPAEAARYLGSLPEAIRKQVIDGAPAEVQTELRNVLAAAAPAAARAAFPKLPPELGTVLNSGTSVPPRLSAAIIENGGYTPSDRGLVPPQLRENTLSIALALAQRTDLTPTQHGQAMTFLRQTEAWMTPADGRASPETMRHLGFIKDAQAELTLRGTFASDEARAAAITEATQLYNQSRQLMISAARAGDAPAAYAMAREFLGVEPAFPADPERKIPEIAFPPNPVLAYEMSTRALRSGRLPAANQEEARKMQVAAKQLFEKMQAEAGKSAEEIARLWKAQTDKIDASIPTVRGDVVTPTLSTASAERTTPVDPALRVALESIPPEVLERPKMAALDVPREDRAPGAAPDESGRGRGAAVAAA